MSDNVSSTFKTRDEFKRKSIAKKLKKILYSDIDISPAIINGDWGAGKTEFCLKLINLIEQDDTHHAVYVDAFKADHTDEPLLAVLSEILKLVPEQNGERQSLIKKALPAVRFSLKTGLKAGVSHLLRQDFSDVVEDYDKDIKKVADKTIDASVEKLLKEHIESEKNLKSLKKTLKTLARTKEIIVFIDELDRCRPDFAINMLETIKHTFNIEGVQFILVTNMEQLKASIKNCYGEDIEAERYLDKFIKYSFSLSIICKDQDNNEIFVGAAHFINLISNSSILSESGLKRQEVVNFASHIIIHNKLSLREVETLVQHLEIYDVLTDSKLLRGEKGHGFTLCRFLGVTLFTFKQNFSSAFLDGSADGYEFSNFLGFNKVSSIDQNDFPCPKDFEVIAIAIGRSFTRNSSHFKIEGMNIEKSWTIRLRDMFLGANFGYSSENYSNIVSEVINTLLFNGE